MPRQSAMGPSIYRERARYHPRWLRMHNRVVGGVATYYTAEGVPQYDHIGRMTQMTQDGQSGGNSVADKRVDFAYNAVGRSARGPSIYCRRSSECVESAGMCQCWVRCFGESQMRKYQDGSNKSAGCGGGG